MVVAIISVMAEISIKNDVAMTGEMSLRGRVLPIGGLKEKLLAAIEVDELLSVNSKSVLLPSINLSILSRTSNWPTDHAVNSSLNIFSISIVNSLNVLLGSVGIPVAPPIGTVSFWRLPYPLPVFWIVKLTTLDPWPTTISIVASVPSPLDVSLYSKLIPLYDSGSSKTTLL